MKNICINIRALPDVDFEIDSILDAITKHSQCCFVRRNDERAEGFSGGIDADQHGLVFDFSCNSDVNWLDCEFRWNNSSATFPIFPIGATDFVDVIDELWIHSDDMLMHHVKIFIKE
jgi:hypothetical protein